MIPRNPAMNDAERRAVALLRLLVQRYTAECSQEIRGVGLADLINALRSIEPRIDLPAGPETDWHGYRFSEVLGTLTDGGNGPYPAGCIVALPTSAPPDSRLFVLDSAGNLLATHIAAGDKDKIFSRGLSAIAIVSPHRTGFGRLRYHDNGFACIPEALAGKQWELLIGRSAREEPFPFACNFATALLLVGGVALALFGIFGPAMPRTAWAFTIVVGLLIGVLGQIWWTRQLWIRNFARWTTVVLAAVLLDAGSIIVALGLAGCNEPGVFATEMISGGAITVGLALASLLSLLLFWNSSPGHGRTLAPSL